ncbi:hypothetical protein, partial [Dickeya chrysanthemi]|uniref:hypothetical protein n=1 Tax=Dickeya chrysanthemi TaxID=556 RepID=UPI001E43E507
WLVAKLRRYALPSAFDFAVRAARDVITRPISGARPTGQRKRCSKTLSAFCPTRHGLSRRPVAHLSAVFDAGKMLHPVLNAFVSSLNNTGSLRAGIIPPAVLPSA